MPPNPETPCSKPFIASYAELLLRPCENVLQAPFALVQLRSASLLGQDQDQDQRQD